jgi:hypothetical protein
MNWDDPSARAALIERVGVAEYNRQFEAHRLATTVETVNGYPIRPTNTRFGRLFMVEGTGNAFYKIEEARAFATSKPAAS